MEGDWKTPPPRRKLKSKKSHNDPSFEDYHRHLVALTSSSYGLLKVDSAKPPEEVWKKNPARVGSMNETHDKLKFLESMDSAPRSWNEGNSVLQTIKPSLEGSYSTPVPGWSAAGVLETIDVADIMHGLEEENSGSSSPSQGAGLVAASSVKQPPPPPPPPPRVLSTNQHNKLDKAASFHTIKDGDVQHCKVDTLAIQDLAREPLEDVSKVFPSLAGSHNEMSTPGRFKEHAKHSGSQNGHLVSQKNVTRRNVPHPRFSPLEGSHHEMSTPGRFKENAKHSGSENGQLVSQENVTRSNTPHPQFSPLPGYQSRQNGHLLTETKIVTKESKKKIVENRSVSRDIPTRINLGVPPNMTYSASSGRLKLTLNLEYENTFFTSTPLSQDGSSPAGASARRSLVNYADVLTEPSSPLFDPALLASYEEALKDLRKEDWNSRHENDELLGIARISKEFGMPFGDDRAVQVSECVWSDPSEPFGDIKSKLQAYDPLDDFERKCPPGGDETVVLYTTTLRGIRKTFEDCNNLREILRSFSIGIDERDVSMHFGFRNELRELMGKVVSVPRMFIKGRYIGGVDEVAKLHEDGKLSDLVKGLPKELNPGTCDGCGGIRFVPCLECCGSCKIVDEDNKVVRCPECNENGLIQCPICS